MSSFVRFMVEYGEMMRISQVLRVLASVGWMMPACADAGRIGTVRGLRRAVYERPAVAESPFDLTARVTRVMHERNNNHTSFLIEQGTPFYMTQVAARETEVRPGDLVRFAGRVRNLVTRKRLNKPYGKRLAEVQSVHVLAHGVPPRPIDTTIRNALEGTLDFRPLRIRAVVRDASRGTINPNWGMIGLVDNANSIAAPILIETCGPDALTSLIGREVIATGFCAPTDMSSYRPGRQFMLFGTNDIEIVAEDARELTAKPLEGIGDLRPSDFYALGLHEVYGTVLATWRDRCALISTASGRIVRLSLTDPVLPDIGDFIQAKGFPESTFFDINLTHAVWKRETAPKTPETIPNDLSIADFFTGKTNTQRPEHTLHGKLVRTRGRILSLPSGTDPEVFFLSDGSRSIPIVAERLGANLHGLAIGCEVEVCGICLVEVEAWHSIMPSFKSVTIIPRRSSDIRMLSHPPWWTPTRMWILIGGLLALVIAVLIRNQIQKHRAIALARLTTSLKVDERTRLAVELHDSIAQNLTGISLELDAAERLSDVDAAKMRKHLSIAMASLKSCRAELRNCLWDLRHQTLETNDMDSAIRQTLEPYAGKINLAIRFNVPRDFISDNTAHTILRIIRELTSNAILHGAATSVKIAGSIENGMLLFSVRDDGCGFDPNDYPNESQGHYGLLGIRERINSFEGEFDIVSKPGSGTKATVSIRLPQGSVAHHRHEIENA